MLTRRVTPYEYVEYSQYLQKLHDERFTPFQSSIDLGFDRFGDYEQRGRTLVYKPKSQTGLKPRAQKERDYRKVDYFHVFKNTVVFKRRAKTFPPKAIQGNRSSIYSFSENSKRNLKRTVINSQYEFVSQFCLTFHQYWPADGKELKRMLNTWLTLCRKKIDNFKYIWILEFQERGAPHFHVYMNQEVSDSLRYFLAISWCRLTNPKMDDIDLEKTTQFRFHDHSKNFIAWDMGSGSYLCKYLDKERQKDVPECFENVGRFWGASRRTVAPPVILECSSLNQHSMTEEQEKASIRITRILGKLHEKRLRSVGHNTGHYIDSRIRHGGQSSTGNYLAEEFKRLVKDLLYPEKTRTEKQLKYKNLHEKISLRTINIPF